MKDVNAMRHVVKDHHRMAWLRDLLYSRHLLTKGYSRTYLIVKHVLRYVLHTDTCNAHTTVHVRFITSKVLLYLLVYVLLCNLTWCVHSCMCLKEWKFKCNYDNMFLFAASTLSVRLFLTCLA